MDLKQIKLGADEGKLLKLLAKAYEAAPPGFMETRLIARGLNIPVLEAKKIIHSLFVKGVVDTDQVEIFAAYLTPEGYELACSL
jgi:hypothetical protein